MLIATLPTLVSDKDLVLSEKILKHPLVDAVRYNTGGASPYKPEMILAKLAPIAAKQDKKLFVDLEGRQVRIAGWTPFSAGSVVLNRDFSIELPAKIHFRGLGWFEILNADPGEKRIFFDGKASSPRYYLGESQSVHVVAKKFEVSGYIQKSDYEFIEAAVKARINAFMLSFVESLDDVYEFSEAFCGCNRGIGIDGWPETVIKIESLKGLRFIEKSSAIIKDFRLMAARDDLFLAHADRKQDFIDALQTIVLKDPRAILASKIMSGLENGDDLTVGDLTDAALMSRMGYRNFMFSDELSRKFDRAMENWQRIIIPLMA